MVGAIAIVYLLLNQRLLLLVGMVAVWRAVQKEQGPGDLKAAGTNTVLIAALSWLRRLLREV